MSVDRSTVQGQRYRLNLCADTLADVHRRLVQYRDTLNMAWKESQTELLTDAIDRLNRQIYRIREELDHIGIDMVRAADEIIAEEQARLEAERREAERREAERQEAERQEAERQEAKRQEEAKKQEEAVRQAAETLLGRLFGKR